MKKQLETWVPVAAIVVSAVSATWVVSGRIAEVRADLSGEIADTRAEIAALDSRLSGVEAKLHLLIEGLDIDVSEQTTGASRRISTTDGARRATGRSHGQVKQAPSGRPVKQNEVAFHLPPPRFNRPPRTRSLRTAIVTPRPRHAGL